MPVCKHCKSKYERTKPLQIVCNSFDCAIGYAKTKAAKDTEKKRKERRRETKERKEAIKTKPRLIKDAQPYFNKFIRLRDWNDPCISCGRYEHEITEKFTGGIWDCGHYLSVGSHDELRFTESNAHKQCKSCNGGSGQYTKKNYTVSMSYRERLIKKIGINEVEFLEGPHPAPHRTHDEIRNIKKKYQLKCKEFSSNNNMTQ